MAEKHRRFLKPVSAAALCAAVLTTMLSYGESRPDADSIKDASLIIGTYLFDFEALNEENQALAEKNAQDVSQNKVYYKSELNSGVWYDITNAENVNDIILSNDKIVDPKVIDALELTLYFKADGTVVDFKTGSIISTQDIDSAVDPSNLSALGTLVNQRKITEGLIESTEDDDEKEEQHENYKAEKDALDAILATINDSTTADLIGKLDALEKAAQSLDGAAADAVAEEKLELRNKLEKHCSEVAKDRIDKQVEALTKRDKTAHAELISILTDCESSLTESINELDSTLGSKSDTTCRKKKEELSGSLIDAALSGDADAVAGAADKLAVLDAIMNGESVDPEKGAAMAEELFDSSLDLIEEIVGSVLDGTNDYYTADPPINSSEVAGGVEVAINEAISFAKTTAALTAGSTSSEEYNKILSDMLGRLGELLDKLASDSGYGTGGTASSDPLCDAVAQTLGEYSGKVLDEAAEAAALADSDLAKDKQKIEGIEEQIDDTYGKYIEALADNDTQAADMHKQELDELDEELTEARADSAAKIKDGMGELISDKSDLLDSDPGSTDSKEAEKKEREQKARINALKDLQSDTDAGLIEQFCDSLDEFDKAAESGSAADTEDAYDSLKDSVANLPESVMDDNTKAAALAYAAEKLEDSGIDGLDELDDRIKEDIAAAQGGTLSPVNGGVSGADSSDSGAGDNGETGEGGTAELPSILDELTQYKLVIPEYDIYSNDMSAEKDGELFVCAKLLAEAVGSQYINADGVFVIKDENVLMEFSADDLTAYVNDKMFALANAPFLLEGEVYIPAELVSAGYGFTAVQEEGTVILR